MPSDLSSRSHNHCQRMLIGIFNHKRPRLIPMNILVLILVCHLSLNGCTLYTIGHSRSFMESEDFIETVKVMKSLQQPTVIQHISYLETSNRGRPVMDRIKCDMLNRVIVTLFERN